MKMQPKAPAVFQEAMRDCDDPATQLFELANAETVRYITRTHRQVDIVQDQNAQTHTGGVIWETAFLLATYLEHELANACALPHAPPPFVLDISAGCGLLGLVLATMGCRVVLTEHPDAMKNLAHNVDNYNRSNRSTPDTRDQEQHDEREQPRAMQLEWGLQHDIDAIKSCRVAPFDIIVGTDIVYQSELVRPLLDTMHALAGEGTVVWMCLQVRCAKAFQTFVDTAPEYFEFAEVPAEGLPGLEHAAELETRLFRMAHRRARPAEGGCESDVGREEGKGEGGAESSARAVRGSVGEVGGGKKQGSPGISEVGGDTKRQCR